MHETERALLQAFSQAPDKEYNTTELVAIVFPTDYQAIREKLHNTDASTKKQAKRHKSQLHRKLLYHLNKLLDKGILKISEIQARGEKAYSLANTASEVLVQDSTDTITITRHERPSRYTVAEEQEKKVYTRSTALHTVDAYAIHAKEYPGIAHLRTQLTRAYAHVNDAICIVDAHSLIDGVQEHMSSAIAQLHADTQDYSLAITLHFDLTQQTLTQKHLSFFRTFALHSPKRMYLLLSVNPTVLSQQQSSIETVLGILSKDKIKINIHNANASANIHFFGQAGSYTISKIQQEALERSGAVIVTNTSMLLDCKRITRAHEHQRILQDASKTLLAHTSAQRRLAHKALNGLAHITDLREQLIAPTAVIRYYNFDLDAEFSTLLTQRKTEAYEFMEIHNRIYASCGVPIDFSLQLSTGFIHYAEVPTRRYKKTAIQSKKDLETQFLSEREQLLRALDTDRVRFFRDTPYTTQELFNELVYLTERYSFPLITYDTKTLQTTLSLQQFLS